MQLILHRLFLNLAILSSFYCATFIFGTTTTVTSSTPSFISIATAESTFTATTVPTSCTPRLATAKMEPLSSHNNETGHSNTNKEEEAGKLVSCAKTTTNSKSLVWSQWTWNARLEATLSPKKVALTLK